jgi:hypothetical protein
VDVVRKKADKRKGPYIAVCGKCNVAIKVHPVKQCPYNYKPVIVNGRTYGYSMTLKP